MPLQASVKRSFDSQVEASLAQQQQLDTALEIPFDKYLNNYFSQNDYPTNIHAENQIRDMPIAETAAP
jgi:glutamate--cysteine ligase